MGDSSSTKVKVSADEDLEREIIVPWVKLGKIWWPGKLVKEDERTDVMKEEFNRVKATVKRTNGKDNIHVVKYFSHFDHKVTVNPQEIILNPDVEKRRDLVKRGLSIMKSSARLATNYLQYKTDVLLAERLLNPSVDLTDMVRLFNDEPLTMFPSATKPVKATGSPPMTPREKRAVNRSISQASSKPPNQLSPLPSIPIKKYRCSYCGFSVERVNVLTNHIQYCGKTSVGNSSLSTAVSFSATSSRSPRSPQKRKAITTLVPPPPTRSRRKSYSPDITSLGMGNPPTPGKRAPGKTPQRESSFLITTTANVQGKSLAKPGPSDTGKSGGPSKKDKMVSEESDQSAVQARKKPRTDKLSNAILQNSKPENANVLGNELPLAGKGREEDTVTAEDEKTVNVLEKEVKDGDDDQVPRQNFLQRAGRYIRMLKQGFTFTVGIRSVSGVFWRRFDFDRYPQ